MGLRPPIPDPRSLTPMSIALHPVPTFYDSVGMILSAADLRAIRRNAAIVDGLSYRQMPCFDSSAGLDTYTVGYYPSSPPFRIWNGYFRFRSGMTTLTIEGSATPAGSETIKVFLNGSGTAAATITPTSSFTQNITISGLGYTDGQIVQVELQVQGSASTATARYVIYDIYASPISFATAWPGVPTFSGTYSALKLNQLSNAAQWLFDRMAATPIVPNLMMRYALGSFGTLPNLRPLWYGSVGRYFSNDIFRLFGVYTNVTDVAQKLYVYINGSLASTLGPFGPGTATISIPVALTHTLGTRVEASVWEETITPGAVQAAWKQSRFSLTYRYSQADGSGYPYATMPADFSPAVNISAATLDSRLNALATVLNNTKTRIDNTPNIWNRARAVRRWFGKNGEDTQGDFDARARPFFARQGYRLVVKGKGVSIGFGPITVPSDPQKGPQYDAHTYGKTESVIDGDKVDTKTVYLDSIDGLVPGTTYQLVGDVQYAEELLS